MPFAAPLPEVSVALCTWNGERFLAEQLDSVLAQEDVAFEVVALDDGSSDGTRALLERYATREPRLRWQANENNLGATASFERAMALCRAGLIAPCDQDDVWHPRKVARLVAAIGDADLVYCDSSYIDAEGRTLDRRVSGDMAMLQGDRPASFLLANSVSGHASLVRRELFERARPFPQGAYHDWWLALCAAGRNGVRYLDEPLVDYRRHAATISPMGKSDASPRDATGSRTWLEHRLRLMRAYAGTGLRDADVAAAFAAALDDAVTHDRKTTLMRLLWKHRDALPPWKGQPMLDALKWQTRLAKKIRRARREPTRDR